MTVEENIRRLLRSPFPDIRGEYTPVPPVYQPQPYEVRPAEVAGIPQSAVAAAGGMSRPAAAPSPAGAAPPTPAADELALPDPAAPTRADYREQAFGERDSVEDDPMGVSARQRQQMAQAQGKPVREFEPPKGPYADLREKNDAKKRAQETAARTTIAMQGLGVLTEQRAKRHSQQGFAGQFVTPAEQLEYLYNQHRTNVPGFAEEYPSFEAYVAGAFGGGSAEDVANRIEQHLSSIEQGPTFPGRTGQGGQGVQEQPRMPMGRRERSTTGVPLEGTDPKEWGGETRGKRGRDLFNPDAQTTPTGGTFTVNPNGSMSMRGVNPESYKVYDDYRHNFGENDERTVMAGAAAVGLDPQKYGDDMVSLAADVQRRMKEVERYQGRFERGGGIGKVDENGVPIRTRANADKPVMWKPEEQVDGSTRLVPTKENRAYNDQVRANALASEVWQRWGAKMQANGMTKQQLEQIAREEGPAGIAKINKAYWDDRMANSRGQLAAQLEQRALMQRLNQGYGPAIVSHQIATAKSPQEVMAAMWLGNLMNQGAARRQEAMVPGGRFSSETVPQGTTGMDVINQMAPNIAAPQPEGNTVDARLAQIQAMPPAQRHAALVEMYTRLGVKDAATAAKNTAEAMEKNDQKPSIFNWWRGSPTTPAPTGGAGGTGGTAPAVPDALGRAKVSAPSRRERMLSGLV